jgi:hypothetical protein
MPTQQELDIAKTKATTLTETAGEYSAGANNVESLLKQKLTEAYKANEDIVEPLDKATATYYQAPSVGREKYQDIFNPFTREELVSQYTGNEALPMLSYSNLYGQRQGSIADTINAGVGAYKAETENAVNQANTAQSFYDQMWKEFQFEETQKLEREKLADKGKDPFTQFLELQAKLKGFEPNSTMITSGQNADTVLKNIENVKNASDKDLSVASKIAAGSGGNAVASIASTYYKMMATPTQISLAEDLVNARNVLRLRFTGAAFSESERPDYAFLTGQDPVLVFGDPNNTRRAFANLEPAFKTISKSGQNPYQDIINNLNTGFLGTGSPESGISSKPIVVQDIITGQYGTLDSENEFDPSKYRRF